MEAQVKDNIKLVFFDMEGTLFRKTKFKVNGNIASSVWPAIGHALGSDAFAKEEASARRWNEGGFKSYLEWVDESVNVFKEYGLTKNKFEEVLSMIEFHPGVKEVFEELNKRGIITALISGGFKAQADRAQTKLGIKHAFSACELFWDDKGSLIHWNSLPCDYQGKADFMSLLITEYGLKPKDCAFVGDGINDTILAKSVGLSISFNGAKELENVCTYAVKQEQGKEDFKEVLKYL